MQKLSRRKFLNLMAGNSIATGLSLAGCESGLFGQTKPKKQPNIIFLLTDDWRLPAITVFLRLGYVPFLCARGMQKRWQAVCANLSVDFRTTNPVALERKRVRS